MCHFGIEKNQQSSTQDVKQEHVYLWRWLSGACVMRQVMKEGLKMKAKTQKVTTREHQNFTWKLQKWGHEGILCPFFCDKTYRCGWDCTRQTEAKDGQFHFCRFFQVLHTKFSITLTQSVQTRDRMVAVLWEKERPYTEVLHNLP